MDLQINCTQDGTISYPLHKHNTYEIMFYTHGEGVLHTPREDYAFVPGTIIVVPPCIEHGSVSKNGFRNISVSGRFENMMHFKDVVAFHDNEQNEGKMLATILYNNRHKNEEYLYRLCSAYLYFILQNITADSNVHKAVGKIINEITNNFYDCNINLSQFLQTSGYAEDYIRAQFKKITQKTPNDFLTDIRIKHAVFLINIYADTLSLQQIAEQCGYVDYVYFSKKFKKVMGISPRKYKTAKS